MRKLLPTLLATLAACSPEAPQGQLANSAEPTTPLDLSAPEGPAGLPKDGTQDAGQVLDRYFALVEERRYLDAYRLWSDGGRATGDSAAAFAKSFDAFREFHAEVGEPGEPQGGAGSIYIEIPVRLHGRMKDGKEFRSRGIMILRRVNNVPGSTAEQRQWRIYNSEFSNASPHSS